MSVITNLLSANNFIVTNKAFAKCVGLYEAVVFAELCSKHNFFSDNNKLDEEGFFYCTAATLQDETTLTTRQQAPVLERLEKLGFITTKLKGTPARKHYKISHENEINFVKAMQDFESQSFDKMSIPVSTKCRNWNVQNVETSLDEMSKQDSTKCRTNKNNNKNNNKNKLTNNNPKTDFSNPVLESDNEIEVFDTPLDTEEKKEKNVAPKKEKKVNEAKAAKEEERQRLAIKYRSHLHNDFIKIYDEWHEGLKGEKIPDVFWKQQVRAMQSIREKFVPLSESKLPTLGLQSTDENILNGFKTFLSNLKSVLSNYEVSKMNPRFLETNLLEFLEKVRNNHGNNSNNRQISSKQQQLVNRFFAGAGKTPA